VEKSPGGGLTKGGGNYSFNSKKRRRSKVCGSHKIADDRHQSGQKEEPRGVSKLRKRKKAKSGRGIRKGLWGATNVPRVEL